MRTNTYTFIKETMSATHVFTAIFRYIVLGINNAATTHILSLETMTMQTTRDFERITSAEGFFEFFDLEYDEAILKTKRYAILKLFSDLVAHPPQLDEQKILEYYRFMLLQVYGKFALGYNPSAADVWGEGANHFGCHGGSGGSCSSDSCKTSCSDHTHEEA